MKNPITRSIPPIMSRSRFAFLRNMAIYGSYLHITKVLPMEASHTCKGKIEICQKPKCMLHHTGIFTDLMSVISWRAPNGHTPAQKLLPKSRVKTSGL
jgi:hypothetical protein